MDALILQDAAVTLVAGGAVWVVIRRLFTVVKPAGGSKCASCPKVARAAEGASAAGDPAPAAGSRTIPLTVVR
jgi:hypothetical protein